MPTMETLALPGRVLYLAANEATIRAQLAGRRLSRAQAGALRDDVSTDEITPVPILTHYDDKLGRYPYTGLSVAGDGKNAIAGLQGTERLRSIHVNHGIGSVDHFRSPPWVNGHSSPADNGGDCKAEIQNT